MEQQLLSSVELVLPPNVVEACYKLAKDSRAGFRAVNKAEQTCTEITLHRQEDCSVRINIAVVSVDGDKAVEDVPMSPNPYTTISAKPKKSVHWESSDIQDNVQPSTSGMTSIKPKIGPITHLEKPSSEGENVESRAASVDIDQGPTERLTRSASQRGSKSSEVSFIRKSSTALQEKNKCITSPDLSQKSWSQNGLASDMKQIESSATDEDPKDQAKEQQSDVETAVPSESAVNSGQAVQKQAIPTSKGQTTISPVDSECVVIMNGEGDIELAAIENTDIPKVAKKTPRKTLASIWGSKKRRRTSNRKVQQSNMKSPSDKNASDLSDQEKSSAADKTVTETRKDKDNSVKTSELNETPIVSQNTRALSRSKSPTQQDPLIYTDGRQEMVVKMSVEATPHTDAGSSYQGKKLSGLCLPQKKRHTMKLAMEKRLLNTETTEQSSEVVTKPDPERSEGMEDITVAKPTMIILDYDADQSRACDGNSEVKVIKSKEMANNAKQCPGELRSGVKNGVAAAESVSVDGRSAKMESVTTVLKNADRVLLGDGEIEHNAELKMLAAVAADTESANKRTNTKTADAMDKPLSIDLELGDPVSESKYPRLSPLTIIDENGKTLSTMPGVTVEMLPSEGPLVIAPDDITDSTTVITGTTSSHGIEIITEIEAEEEEIKPSTIITLPPNITPNVMVRELMKMATHQKAKELGKLDEPVETPSKKRAYKREFKIQCRYCTVKLKDYGYLFRHLKKLHSDHAGLDAYLQEIRPLMRTPCPICNKMVSSISNISAHIKQCHSENDSSVNCPVCCKKYKTPVSLRQHLRQCHQRQQRTFPCHICGVQFTENRSLKEHINCTHETTQVFYCDICHKSFLTKGRLRRHKYIHGDFRHFCPYCKKGFHLKDNMNKHVEIVHEQKRGRQYECEYCRKQFTVKGNMVQHVMGVHLKVFQYNCTFCKLGFRRKKDFISHLTKHHNARQDPPEVVAQRKEVTGQVAAAAAVMGDDDDDDDYSDLPTDEEGIDMMETTISQSTDADTSVEYDGGSESMMITKRESTSSGDEELTLEVLNSENNVITIVSK